MGTSSSSFHSHALSHLSLIQPAKLVWDIKGLVPSYTFSKMGIRTWTLSEEDFHLVTLIAETLPWEERFNVLFSRLFGLAPDHGSSGNGSGTSRPGCGPRSGCDTLSSHIFTLHILPPGNPRYMKHSSFHHEEEPLSPWTACDNWTLSRKHSLQEAWPSSPCPRKALLKCHQCTTQQGSGMTAFNREQDTRGGMLNSSVFHMPVTVGVQEGNGTKLPVLIASWSPKEGQNTYNCHCSNDDTVFPRNAVSF